ncbi:MAG: hypothetical protein KDB26_15805 [Microthrixaceae bacterium]|nr:hypothetical protein [Microthrixaceae bacterium]
MLTAHADWALVVIFTNLIAGIWALGAHWLAALRVKQLWWAVIAAQATIFVQVVLGVYLVSIGGLKAPGMHMFYGFIGIVSVGVIYSYRTQLKAWMYMLYGLGSFFLVGLMLRAYFLA